MRSEFQAVCAGLRPLLNLGSAASWLCDRGQVTQMSVDIKFPHCKKTLYTTRLPTVRVN